jgi:integrase
MRGHIRRRSGKSWSIVLDIGRDANGKRRQKWHTVQGSKRDAQRELARLINELETGAYIEPNRLTVTGYLSQWLETYAKLNVSAKTFERYEIIVRKHLIPALGHHALARLRPLHIQEYYAKDLQSGRRNGKGGLSAQTVLHHHRVLREALQQGIRWQLIVRNAADATEPPRPVRQERRTLDADQAAQLIDAVRGKRLFIPVLLAITTGMRRGEILALRWDDLDFSAMSLAVRQSVSQTKAGLLFKQPKTPKGRRVIALPSLAIDALRRHKTEQAQERLLLGPAYQEGNLVCANQDGSTWAPDTFTVAFKTFVRSSGLPRVRFHDLRHTHATQLLRQGIHPKVVSERLGHSSVGFTLDVYSHVLPDIQQDAASKLDTVIRAALGGRLQQSKPDPA